jgi:hypothetical protein
MRALRGGCKEAAGGFRWGKGPATAAFIIRTASHVALPPNANNADPMNHGAGRCARSDSEAMAGSTAWRMANSKWQTAEGDVRKQRKAERRIKTTLKKSASWPGRLEGYWRHMPQET